MAQSLNPQILSPVSIDAVPRNPVINQANGTVDSEAGGFARVLDRQRTDSAAAPPSSRQPRADGGKDLPSGRTDTAAAPDGAPGDESGELAPAAAGTVVPVTTDSSALPASLSARGSTAPAAAAAFPVAPMTDVPEPGAGTGSNELTTTLRSDAAAWRREGATASRVADGLSPASRAIAGSAVSADRTAASVSSGADRAPATDTAAAAAQRSDTEEIVLAGELRRASTSADTIARRGGAGPVPGPDSAAAAAGTAAARFEGARGQAVAEPGPAIAAETSPDLPEPLRSAAATPRTDAAPVVQPAPGAAVLAATPAAGAGTAAASAPEPGGWMPEYALEHAPEDVEFPREVTARMKLLLRDGVREARLQLHPAELGRLQVSVTTDGDQARVAFVTETAAAREAIEQSMPRLRDMLEQNGLQLAGSDVEQEGLASRDGTDGGDDDRASSDGRRDPLDEAGADTRTAVLHRGAIDTYI